MCGIKHGVCLISYLTDVCPLRLIGSGVTVGPRAPRGVAAGEAGHLHPVQSGQRDQNAPTAHTLKTHLPAPHIKTPHDPATKSPPRGKTVCPGLLFMSSLEPGFWPFHHFQYYILSPQVSVTSHTQTIQEVALQDAQEVSKEVPLQV